MSATNAFEGDLLKHLFQNTDIANVGDATGLRGSSVAGNFHVALFTADPGESGSVANEASYTGYARKSVARSASEWTESSGTIINANAVTFAPCTGGSNTITHFGICKAGTTGVADLLLTGALTASLAVSNGVTPSFAASQLTISAD